MKALLAHPRRALAPTQISAWTFLFGLVAVLLVVMATSRSAAARRTLPDEGRPNRSTRLAAVIGPAVEIVVGIAVVLLTLGDVFDTVVVPGESRGLLRILRRLLSAFFPLWKMTRRGRSGVSTSFGPFVLMAAFAS